MATINVPDGNALLTDAVDALVGIKVNMDQVLVIKALLDDIPVEGGVDPLVAQYGLDAPTATLLRETLADTSTGVHVFLGHQAQTGQDNYLYKARRLGALRWTP